MTTTTETRPPKLPPLNPPFHPSPTAKEPPHLQSLIQTLHLAPHIEGGYFLETDRDPTTIPNPFPPTTHASEQTLRLLESPHREGFDPSRRNLSTSIYFLITPRTPTGHFCRNRARTVHTLHRGRGRYVMIHGGGRVESFVVGGDVGRGERMQWVVEGGVWKASFLLPDGGGDEAIMNGVGGVDGDGHGAGYKSEGLLISETVVPGFEYCDHEFLKASELTHLVGESKAAELEWLCHKDDK